MKLPFAILSSFILQAFAMSHRPTLYNIDKYLISLGFHQDLVHSALPQDSDIYAKLSNLDCAGNCTCCLPYEMIFSVTNIEVGGQCSKDSMLLQLDDQTKCAENLDIALQRSLQYIKYADCYYKRQKFTSAQSKARVNAYSFGFFERYLSESDIFLFVVGQGIHPCYIPETSPHIKEFEQEPNAKAEVEVEENPVVAPKRKTLEQLEKELDEVLVSGMRVPHICLVDNNNRCNRIAKSWIEAGKKAVLLTRKIARRKIEERSHFRRK